MILRKPYALLIRHFKLLHFILSVAIIYLLIRITGTIDFINDYLNSNLTMISESSFLGAFNWLDFAIPIFSLAFSITLFAIMTWKKKPNKLYLYAILISVFTLFVNIYGYSTLKALTKEWLDVSRLDVLTDFYVTAMILNMVLCAMSISRAFGFNIGRFDFNSDISKFDLSEEDNAEFEVALDFDINDVKRNAKKQMRYIKYFYRENKRTIFSALILIVITGALYAGFSYLKYSKDITKGDTLKYNGFSVKINNSYIVDRDASGKKLKDDKHLLVIDADITNYGFKNPTAFSRGSLNVTIGSDIYFSSKSFSLAISDLGQMYNDEKIAQNSTYEGLLVFDIPENHLHSKILLGVTDINGQKTHYAEIKPTDLSNAEEKVIEKELGDELVLENTTLKDIKFRFDSYDIQTKYKVNYRYCANQTRCINATEYIVPRNETSNSDKAIIKLTGTYNYDAGNIYNSFYKLLYNFGYLEYTIDGQVHTQKTTLRETKSSRTSQPDTQYIEVYKDLMSASDVWLGLKIRNIDYRYHLKEARG